MNLIRKQVPVLSLIACIGLLWGLWRLTEADVAPVTLAVSAGVPTAKPRTIRVGVTAESVRELSLEISEPFHVRPVGSDKVLFEAPRLGATKVTATPRGLKIGKRDFPVTRLEIDVAKSPAIWIDQHQYRGRMRLFRQSGGMVLAVNVVPLEEYIASVIDSEMPGDFPDEARKAQAVVARTYALYQMNLAGPDAVLDLYASTRSQKYLGFQYREPGGRLLAGESAAGRRIGESTRGQVCTYRGKVFCTYYCAVCGGSTVQGTNVFSDAAPPLQPVKCDWCREARLYRWTAEISRRDAQADLEPLLRKNGTKTGALKAVSLVRTKEAGSIPEFDLRTDRQSVRVSGA
ncbi:MAG TPA: SpoIID/LytB domain-containing protein, partial [Planctomycetaceae bacterium]|nr:SpoIID/LytB domain-containing protein [Planctomycetaceae bacterium]